MNRPPIITLHALARAILAIPELADVEIGELRGELWQNEYRRKGSICVQDRGENPRFTYRAVEMRDNNDEGTNHKIFRLDIQEGK